ncbi:factor of DNA methylation 1 [Tanacetum coccineum]
MEYCSGEESELSDSEIFEYKDKPYEQLKVKNPNGILKCPFYVGKKKQNFKHKDLYQHASGVSKGSSNSPRIIISGEESELSESEIFEYKDKPYEQLRSKILMASLSVLFMLDLPNRSEKQKTNHLALALYSENKPVNEVEQPLNVACLIPEVPRPKETDLLYWPWTGIVVNIVKEADSVKEVENAVYWMERFIKYKPESMEYCSGEESELSESEIFEYKDKPYEQLKVKNPNGILKCPFYAGKKKQNFKHKDLYQHASGVSKGSSNRSEKQKTNEVEQPLNVACLIPEVPRPKETDLLYWPWTGIVVNIVKEADSVKEVENAVYWMERFIKYKPKSVEILWDDQRQSAQVLIRFNSDWISFNDACMFEKALQLLITVRQNGVLLKILQIKCNQNHMSMSRMLKEIDRGHQAYTEARTKIQDDARVHVQRVLDDQDKLTADLEKPTKELDSRSKELNKKEAFTELILNDAQKKSLSMASLEQKLSGEEMNQLLEEKKREKEEALRKYIELQKKLASDHKRDMELKELEVKIQVLEHRGDDATVQEKLKKLYDEKKAKIEEKEATEEMN